MTVDIRAELEQRLQALGFARMGVARAEPLEPEGQRLRDFIAAGRHGSMTWLADTAAVRSDPSSERMLASAASIVVVAAPYGRGGERVGPAPGRVARYAWGRDYHNVLHKKLRKVSAWLRELGHEARVSVDSMPVFERAWAQRAGVGFVGKNCCLIVPGLGSHVFLAAIVTSAELPADEPMNERCGSCRECLDACPTDAFVDTRQLDARRCISYLTIEHDGIIEDELRALMGDWLFGCDVCQDVCPFNHGRVDQRQESDVTLAAPFEAHERFEHTTAEDVVGFDDEAFLRWAEGSPLRRAGRRALARNAAIVLGNSGDRRHLPVLAQAAEHYDDDTVRDAAGWAAAQLSASSDSG